MLKALIISNGIEGLASLYADTENIAYHIVEVEKDFRPDLSGYDVLIVPNGSDHIAMYKIRDKIAAFLEEGKTLICVDGWFTDWVPGNRWIMDNTKKSIETRYRIKDDPFGISEQFSAEDLTFSHGISGWWSCGYIEPARDATVFLEDTWGRAIVVIDEKTTKGLTILTASGPAADFQYATTDDLKAYTAMSNLYKAFVKLASSRKLALQ